MLFVEALESLQAGNAVRRQSWDEQEGYLKILPGMKFVWKIVLLPNPNAGNFIFSIEDFMGDDWFVVNPVEPFPKAIEVDEEE